MISVKLLLDAHSGTRCFRYQRPSFLGLYLRECNEKRTEIVIVPCFAMDSTSAANSIPYYGGIAVTSG